MRRGPADTELMLREALDALAVTVHADPGGYGLARAQWRRRERRRRIILALLIAIVFAAADVIGLWALNQATSGPDVIFNDQEPVRQDELPFDSELTPELPLQ